MKLKRRMKYFLPTLKNYTCVSLGRLNNNSYHQYLQSLSYKNLIKTYTEYYSKILTIKLNFKYMAAEHHGIRYFVIVTWF